MSAVRRASRVFCKVVVCSCASRLVSAKRCECSSPAASNCICSCSVNCWHSFQLSAARRSASNIFCDARFSAVSTRFSACTRTRSSSEWALSRPSNPSLRSERFSCWSSATAATRAAAARFSASLCDCSARSMRTAASRLHVSNSWRKSLHSC